MNKQQVLDRVQAWYDYNAAYLAWHRANSNDYSAVTSCLAEMKRAKDDLTWLKRGTNWRNFEREGYVQGSRTPWTFVYPSPIASRLYF